MERKIVKFVKAIKMLTITGMIVVRRNIGKQTLQPSSDFEYCEIRKGDAKRYAKNHHIINAFFNHKVNVVNSLSLNSTHWGRYVLLWTRPLENKSYTIYPVLVRDWWTGLQKKLDSRQKVIVLERIPLLPFIKVLSSFAKLSYSVQ